jgi:hypothetical protein
VSKSQSTASGNNSWWATLSVSAMSAALGLQATVLNNGGVRKKKRFCDAILCVLQPNIYQDRLGTDNRKIVN